VVAATLTGAGSLAGGGIIAAVILVLNFPLALAAIGGGAVALTGMAGTAAVAKAHRKLVARAQLALDQVLDQIEHGGGAPKPRLLDQIQSVVKVIR
jgi:hypothetical protein